MSAGSDPGDVAPDEPGAPERNTVLLVVVGVLGALSLVIVALVIFSSGGEPARKPDAAAPVRVSGQALVLGARSAPTTVLVGEDFADPDSRSFEIASRDFLRIEAARGDVQVQYRPAVVGDDGYAHDAWAAWLTVLRSGTPRQALVFHDALFDRQPEPGTSEHDFAAWAKDRGIEDPALLDALRSADGGEADGGAAGGGATTALSVEVDGVPLTGRTPVQLADRLQRLLLERAPTG